MSDPVQLARSSNGSDIPGVETAPSILIARDDNSGLDTMVGDLDGTDGQDSRFCNAVRT